MNKILKTKKSKFQKKIKDAPKTPGVYLYKCEEEIIYVGKAKNLFNRINSYFNNYEKLDIQKMTMIDKSDDIEIIEVDSEVEALILETNLIKKYKPRYNIMMRDDKNYIYVRFERVRKSGQKIPTAKSVYQDYPRITITRQKKDDGAEYFGPYPAKLPVKRVLRKIMKVFPYRTSNHLVYQISENPLKVYTANSKPDLYYHIGLSKGTDAGLESKKEYVKRFNQIRKFFKGEKKDILREYEVELNKTIKNLEFEKAAEFRDKINDIKYITANIKIDNEVDDVVIKDLQKNQREKAINELIEEVNFPEDVLKNKNGFRIETYDISNIQGTNAVGSMVVMIDGEIRPDMYRRFKIRMKNEPNDFAMLQEVLTRRFRQLLLNNEDAKENLPDELKKRLKNWKEDESFKQIPDLIIIDGGKGQLASIYKILYQFGLHDKIPIVGLAKKQEEIFKVSDQFKDEYFNQVNDSDRFEKILLSRRSESLFLVQRIRDEAHRFAITYHRNLRSKKALIS